MSAPPSLISEDTQAVQPVEQNFVFEGYYVPTAFFQDPAVNQSRTLPLGEPVIYQQFRYEDPFSLVCEWSGDVRIAFAGKLNALRVITKNILAILLENRSTVEWWNQYLVVPLATALDVTPGQSLHVQLNYAAGGPLSTFDPIVSAKAPDQ